MTDEIVSTDDSETITRGDRSDGEEESSWTVSKVVVAEGYDDDVLPNSQQTKASKATTPPVEQVNAAFNKAMNKVEGARLSAADMRLLQRLNNAYQTEMDVNQQANYARYQTLKQTVVVAIAAMATLQLIAVLVGVYIAGWSVADGLLFGMYSVTSAGFGNVEIPETTGFIIYVIVFVFLGISALAILVAQTYQYLHFETITLTHARDKSVMAKEGKKTLHRLLNAKGMEPTVDTVIRQDILRSLKRIPVPNSPWLLCAGGKKNSNSFVNMHPDLWRALTVVGFLGGLLLIGTIVLCFTENWTFIEGLYFCTFAMTTVGYGDIVPVKQSSTWFVVFWLPFNVAFLSVYLGSVAHYFVRISNWNVARIEGNLRKQRLAQMTKDVMAEVSVESGDDASDDSDDENDWNNTSPTAQKMNRRERIRQVSRLSFTDDSVDSQEPVTTKALLEMLAAAKDDEISLRDIAPSESLSEQRRRLMPAMEALLRSTNQTDGPSLALRLLCEKRCARIVALDVAGFQSSMEISGATFILTIESLKETAEKWHIPSRARRAFRVAAFESLFYVGANEIMEGGLDAFLSLNPFEFHNLFRRFTVALGDKETMEAWLASTEALVQRRTKQTLQIIQEDPDEEDAGQQRKPAHLSIKNDVESYFPVNAGNAVIINL